MTDKREIGSLTLDDVGSQVRLEFEGWVHTGEVQSVHHERGFKDRRNTYISIRSESGARWSKYLAGDHPIEFQ